MEEAGDVREVAAGVAFPFADGGCPLGGVSADHVWLVFCGWLCAFEG
jgi:hypothetical protein